MNKAEIIKAFDNLNAKYRYALVQLQEAQQLLAEQQPSQGTDLQEAARLMAQSELNKEDLSEKEILELLQKSSEEDVKRKIGFWAMPLPSEDSDQVVNKKYSGKSR